MLRWLRELDDLLRGNKTRPELLAVGTRHMPLGPFAGMGLVLGIIYGLFMGLFAILSRASPCYEQLAAAAIKVPALFFLTLVVTYPSLYVFGALLGVRLGPGDMLRLVVAALAVNLAVLASFGPITGFFTLSTTSYHFMKLLNVAFFAISGFIGLAFLLKALERLEESQGASGARPPPLPAEGGAAGPPAPPVQAHVPWPPAERPSKALEGPRCLPGLGHPLRPRRRADGLDPEALHPRPQARLRALPRPPGQHLPRRPPVPRQAPGRKVAGPCDAGVLPPSR